jgi:hypothetical protein
MNTDVAAVIAALTPENMADEILQMWTRFKNARTSWEEEMVELRAFQFATSTRTTEANQPGFKNSTTIPKLSQIATNLRANYNAHLFSNPNWVQFEAHDKDSATLEQRNVVEAYARTKAERKDYEGILGTCLDDWLFAGATFAQQRYVTEWGKDGNDNDIVTYQGPVLEKIAPADIAFDVTASSFQAARKVIRRVYTIGDIAKMVNSDEHSAFTPELLENLRITRNNVRSAGYTVAPEGVDWKQTALTRDGFGNLLDYMNSDIVEVHEFYGDMYSLDTGEFLENYRITVIDRRMVIDKTPITTANGSQYLYYATPETRPDNLMGMSPLARIVGMQYKLDKLENMRADIFDQIANPTVVEQGDVEFYGTRGAPGGRYVTDEQGNVRYLVPDSTILNADFQIRNVMEMMEELAGSPRNASGFRTPGEKTKFEVQVLDNGGNRIFRDRTKSFERTFLEPILNDMIQLARENLGETDLVSTTSNQFNTTEFLEVRRDTLAVSGQLRARGSQLFAEKANALQNLTTILGQPVAQIFNQHISRIKLAQALEELGDFKEFGIIVPNIGIQEDQETQRLAQRSQGTTQAADVVAASEPAELEPELEEEVEE